jgi:hypothetical protein
MCQQKVTMPDPWQTELKAVMEDENGIDDQKLMTLLFKPEPELPARSMIVLSWTAVKELKVSGYKVELWHYPANSLVPQKTVLDFHQDHYNAMRCARTWAAQYQIECKGVIDD